MLLSKIANMKRRGILSIFCLLFMPISMFADERSDSVKKAVGSGPYKFAWIDVKDEAHNYKIGEEPGGDETFIRGMISEMLDKCGIDSSFSDEPDADLKVVCWFKHGPRKPVITPGGGIKTSWVNQCSLKIAEKRSGRILFERTYEWKKDNVDVANFIKHAFKEWKEQIKKGEASKAKPDGDSKK